MCAALLAPALHTLLCAAFLHGLLQVLALLLFIDRRVPGSWKMFDIGLLRRQVGWSVPLGISGLALPLQSDLHMYFVGNTFSPVEFAAYAVGCFQLPLLGLVRESVHTALTRQMSILEQQGARKSMKSAFLSSVRQLSNIYIPAYVLLLCFGRELLSILFTSRYHGSWPIFL